MNKTKNQSEHHLYLYRGKKTIYFSLSSLSLLFDGNNCRTDFYTQLMTKKNEYMSFFSLQGRSTTIVVVTDGGILFKEEICTADAKNDGNDY
jgi:hypothetical protein